MASIGVSSSGTVMRDREQRHRPPHDPPRARAERLQHERRDQAGGQDAEPGPGVEQAEQEIRPRRLRLRDRRRQRAAGDESERRADARRAAARSSARRNCPIARTAPATRTQASVPQRTAADRPNRRMSLRGHQRAGEIAGRIDRVHETRGRIRPAERIAHVRQHQRIGEAADAEADGRRQRQDQDQPRGMRRWRGSGRGLSRDSPAGAALWQAMPACTGARPQWCLAISATPL